MADASESIKHISLERLALYDSLIKDYIDAEDLKALKTVALSQNGTSLNFYTVEEPVGNTEPAFTIELPQPNLEPYVQRVASATEGNLASLTATGGIQDSGIATSAVATKSYVDTAVATGIASTTHLSKQIVNTLPTVAEASENTIYLVKDASVSGADQYEEWMLIGNQLVMIGDTSTDLSQYSTTAQMESAIAAAKSEALSEAAADYDPKISAAISTAEEYADDAVSPVAGRVSTLESNYTALSDNVSFLTGTVSGHTSRIEALEAGGVDIEIATEAEIRSLFTAGS